MEKYIIIFVILATIYYIQTQLKNTEGFADVPTQGLGGVDDTNAINTLAQIAKNLMAGSLTIPGSLTLKGDLVFPDANTIKAAGRLHISPGEILYLLPKANVIIGKEWGGTGDLVVQGNQTVGGNIGITGNQTVGGNIAITGNEDIKGNLTVTGNETVNGIMTIGGALMMAPIYRKHMPAGYIFVRAYGFKIPLYYGFNQMWPDHNVAMVVKSKLGAKQNMMHYTNIDIRQAGDPNWTPRYLTVLPGYKIRLYYWGPFFVAKDAAYATGEYDWEGGSPGNALHGAYVSLAEENPGPDRIDW